MLDSNRLDGRTALVTGAAGEIGAATVRWLLARGARMAAVDRDEHALERLLTGRGHSGKLIGFRGDVSDEASVASVVAAAVSVRGQSTPG